MSEVAVPAAGATRPPAVATRLIQIASDKQVYTGNATTDARQATQRGLAEYISQLVGTAPGGRRVQLAKVFEEWAEPEEHSAYPSAVVRTPGTTTFEPRRMGAPFPTPECRLPAPDSRYFLVSNDAVQDLQVEVWCTDPRERIAMGQLLERAFNPVSYRAGFVLELPHYYNARGTYVLKDVTVPDDDSDAVRRYRRLQYTLGSTVPQLQLFSFPDAKPEFTLEEIGVDVIVTTEVT